MNKSLAEQATQLATDEQALRKLEDAIKSEVKYEDVFDDAMQGASVSAKEYAIETKGAAGSTEIFVNKQKQAQTQLQATTVAMKALSIAANIGIMLAINSAIAIGTKIWDNYNETVAEAEEKLNETQSVIADLETQIKELESIDANALTQGQKDKLDNLKEQLSIQKQLEEIEKRRVAREKLGTGNWSDQFDEDSYAKAKKEMEKAKSDYNVDSRSFAPYQQAIENLKYWSDLYEKEKNKTGSTDYRLDTIEYQLEASRNAVKSYTEDIGGMYNSLLSQKADIQTWHTFLQDGIDSGLFVGKDLEYANEELERLSGELTWVEGQMKYINELLYGGDDSIENTIAEKTKYSYKNLIDNEFSEEDLQLLATLTFDKNASIAELREILAEAKKTTDDFANKTGNLTDIFSLEDSEGTLTNLGKLSEEIDTIQNACKTLSSAIDEYNNTGSFSIDTLQSVIALGDDWLDYLVDENGNLKLDNESLQQLTASRLNDMRVQAINNVIDNVSKIEDETQAKKYLASTNYAAANSYEELAQKRLTALRLTLSEKGVGANVINSVMNKATADIEKINKLFDNVNLGSVSLGCGEGSSSSKSEFSELVDFFERRVKVLSDALELLDTNLENVSGSFAKNKLVDGQLAINEEKIKNYSDALQMYTEGAELALSKLPADIAEKVKNGAVIAKTIDEYEKWADKVADCQKELAQLKETLRQLELEKFNNIMDDFQAQFDIRDNSISLLEKQIALFEETGELIGESFYTEQLEQSQKQLQILEQEKAKLVEQISSAISIGRIQEGTDEWIEMINSLSDLDGQILECKTSIEELDNALLDLDDQVFERVQEKFSNLNNELEHLIGLFDDLDVGTTDGNWTKEGITQLGILTQQFELAQYQAQQYGKEIEDLNTDYLNGRYSSTEYATKLAELTEKQWEAVESSESIKDAIMELNESRINIQIEGIEEEIDAFKELTDAQIEALDREKD